MLAYGSLAANVCFKSVKRRAIFMVAAIVLPVLANGIRAFGTIYIGYLTNSNFARSFDHVVYGWFFFAFVMGVLMLVSWRWFDRKLGDPWLERLPAFTPTRFTPVQAALATLMIMLLPLVWTTAVARSGHIPVTHSIALPNVPGWQRIQMSDGPPWSPRFDGADHRLIGRYRNAAGETVDLAVALYGWQDERRKIIGYGHGAVDPDGPWRWTSDESAPAGGKAERIMGVGKVTRLVESFYVVGGAVSANPASIKWRTMAAKLTGSDQSATAVLISAQERDGYARAACDHFADALGPIEKLAAGFVATARGQ
jgi:EpsI family protein